VRNIAPYIAFDYFSAISACTCERQGNAGTGVLSVAILIDW